MDPEVSNGANFRCPPGTATWTMTIRSEGLDGTWCARAQWVEQPRLVSG